MKFVNEEQRKTLDWIRRAHVSEHAALHRGSVKALIRRGLAERADVGAGFKITLAGETYLLGFRDGKGWS